MKITQLTKEQEAQLPVTRDKWLAIGLSTEPFSRKQAEDILTPLHTDILDRKMPEVIVADNPLQAWRMVVVFATLEHLRTTTDAFLTEAELPAENPDRQARLFEIYSQLASDEREAIRLQVERTLQERADTGPWQRAKCLVWQQVRRIIVDAAFASASQRSSSTSGKSTDALIKEATDLESQAYHENLEAYEKFSESFVDQVLEKYSQQPAEEKSICWPWMVGSFDAGIMSFYDYNLNVLGVEIEAEMLRKWNIWAATCQLGPIFPLDNVCIVVQKPSQILRNEHGLHCDGGPALRYEGMEIFALNGVRVPEYLAVTPSHQLDMEWFQRESNADVRTEFVRKVGIERMLSHGTKIDTYENYDEEWWTKSEYELWDMAALFPNLTYQPYLKMLNQTTKVWHVEAVSPQCRTLEDAIKERFGGRSFKIKHIA